MDDAPKVHYRQYLMSDYAQLKAVMQAAYVELGDAYASEEEMYLLHTLYPPGQIVAFLEDKMIGAIIGRVLPYDVYTRPHTQEESINLSRYIADAHNGDCVYELDIFVNPQYHNLKIGQVLIGLFMDATHSDNFKAIIGVSRLGKYHLFQHELSIDDYVQKVCNKELYDPVLSFHLRYGATVIQIAPNFNPEDVNSLGYGIIMQVLNPKYDPSLPTYPNRAANLAKLKS